MAKHLPDYHSPLLALGKKVLLWFIAPAALVVGVFYGLSTDGTRELILDAFFKSPKQQKEEADRKEHMKSIQETYDKITEAFRQMNREDEAQKLKLGTDPDAIRASPEELDAAHKDPAKATALVRKQIAAAEARKAAKAALPAPATATASGGYQAVTPPSSAYRLERQSPTDVRIVAKASTIPAGTVVKDGNDVVAQCSTTAPCTELKLSKAPDEPGDLDIRDASGKLIGSISVNDKTVGMIMGTIPPPR